MSWRIAGEIMRLLSGQGWERILTEVKKATFFVIMLDSRTDVNHKDRMAFMIRYARVDEEAQDGGSWEFSRVWSIVLGTKAEAVET